MHNKRLKWGILGTANIAQRALIPAFTSSKTNEVLAVASRSLSKAKSFAQTNAIPKAYGTYDELLQDAELDAIYIPLPNSQHHDWAIAAMQAGKHVLCEKPIGLNAHEAQEMIAVADEQHVTLMEGFMYRYHPRFAQTLKLIQDRVLGDLHFIHAVFTFNIASPNDIRLSAELGGGALYDLGCYCIEWSRHIAQREPLAVQAFYQPSSSGVDMQMSANLDFGTNLYAQFEIGFNTYPRRVIRVAGTNGSLDIDEPYYTHGKMVSSILTTKAGTRTLRYRGTNEYQLMVDHFQCVVAGEEAPRFPLSHFVADMRLIDALFESAHANGKLVIIDTTGTKPDEILIN